MDQPDAPAPQPEREPLSGPPATPLLKSWDEKLRKGLIAEFVAKFPTIAAGGVLAVLFGTMVLSAAAGCWLGTPSDREYARELAKHGNAQAAVFQQQVNAANERATKAEQNVSAARAETHTIRKKMEELQRAVGTPDDLRNMRAQLETLKNERATLQEQMRRLSAENTDLRAQIEKLRTPK